MKDAMKKSILTTALASTLIGGGAATTANAHQTAVFNGSMCVRVSGPMFRQNWGSIYNPSNTTAARVLCPIVTTYVQSIRDATVRVTDRNADIGQHVSCELVVVARDDNTSAPIRTRTGRQSSQGFGSDLQELSFSYQDFSPNQSIPHYDNASKSFLCTIPPQSGTGPSFIHHYTVHFGN